MYLIDSHCHLHDREFFSETEAEAALARAHKNGVEKIICIGTSHEDSLTARDFAATHDNVYWTYGIHPNEARALAEPTFSEAEQTTDTWSGVLSEHLFLGPLRGARPSLRPFERGVSATPDQVYRPPVAIGEVGLDYHYDGYDRNAQIKLFEQMLQLAQDNDLPVSFHIREAFTDFFPVVSNFPSISGVVHSFTDSKKTLKRILDETDFYIGVNGLATYSTLPLPPLERILLETDAPFLAPVPHRGTTNEPAYITDIAKWLAEKTNTPITEVTQITTNNTNTLFSLPPSAEPPLDQ